MRHDLDDMGYEAVLAWESGTLRMLETALSDAQNAHRETARVLDIRSRELHKAEVALAEEKRRFAHRLGVVAGIDHKTLFEAHELFTVVDDGEAWIVVRGKP